MREIHFFAEICLNPICSRVLLLKELTEVLKPKTRSELLCSIEDSEMDGSSFHNSRHYFLISVQIELKHHLNSTYSFALCIDMSGSLLSTQEGGSLVNFLPFAFVQALLDLLSLSLGDFPFPLLAASS